VSRAVRFDAYGDAHVLYVDDVPRPVPGPGEVLVAVRAAGINPGEAKIREGLLHERWPATFPSGQGSDLAGVVAEVGDGVDAWQVGDEVLGFTDDRASQAEHVLVPAEHLTAKPPELAWEVAGALFVVGATAWAAVRAVAPAPGEHVVVSGGAGGVGLLVVQLLVRAGATPVALASERNDAWLRVHGAVPVPYGDGVQARIAAAAPDGVAAFVDTVGDGYVEIALALGVPPERIDTIVDFDAVGRHGVQAEGNAAGASAGVLAELAGLLAAGELELPIAATYPLDAVQDAYGALAGRHPLGKIVLVP
jgi:NADPH:quinone reductase-like Zn-dependent oxidoreductase